ncbi:MAG: arginyl-tRNA--protein-N-Asp/Glu arginylyltransferase [Paracoccaceae bacterium]|jgi:arginyl-tRNA--protein-N-Asp/Glu arginylyltransferase
MNQQLIRPDRFFFGTRSLPCPYIEGQTERKVVTDLSGHNAEELYERLSRAGFRRSHNLAYRPACPTCNACIPVRIVARDFETTKSFRRVMSANADLTADDTDAIATVEQYRLFSAYQRARHEGGDMSGMAFNDYRAMVEDTPVTSRTVEFHDGDGALVAVMLMDRMEDSLSAVYSFFDGSMARRSLGTFMILWMVEYARTLGLPYVYLGYWIDGSAKMAYKARFQPLEVLGTDGWTVRRP